jgi:hypothetical protein
MSIGKVLSQEREYLRMELFSLFQLGKEAAVELQGCGQVV